MANEDTKIRFSIINDATAVLEKIRSDFLDLSKTLSAKELSGATLNQLESRLRAVRAELANVSPESANFEKLAAEARRLGDAIDTVNAKAKDQTFEIRAAAGSMAELEARVKAVRAELLKTDPKSARFQELAKQAAQLDAELSKVSDEVIKFANQSKKAGSDFLNSLTGINQGLELASKGLGLLTSAASGLASAATDVGGLEDALTRVQTQTRATAEEQKILSEAIRQALTDTRFGADEAGAALLTLAKDGQNATESAQNLGAVLAYAQANAQGATQAAQGLGDVLDNFGAPAEQIGALADALTATAQAAGTSTETLQQGLAGVGLEAQNAGLSLNQTLAILGQLAQRGLEGGAAAAALNKALTSLQNPSAALSGVFDDLNLTGKSVSEILTTLQGNSAAAEKVLSELGDRPRRALRLLVQEGGGDLKKFAEAIDSSAGASQKAAEALNNTFLGSLQRIQNQLTLLKNDVLAPILKPLADEFDSFAKQLQEFSKSEEFAKLTEDIRKFASDGLKAVGDFVRDFDFAEALKNAQAFASDVIVVFRGVASAIRGTAGAIESVSNALAVTSPASLTIGLYELANGANVSEVGVRALKEQLGLTDEQLAAMGINARQAAVDLPKVGEAAAQSAAGVESFGDGVEKLAQRLARLAIGNAGFKALSEGVGKFRAELVRVPEPAKLLEGTFTDLESALQSQIGVLRDAQAAYQKAFSAGKGGADEAWQAVKRAGAQVADLRRQIDATKGSAIGLTDAFKELGFQSQAALEAAARKGGEAFDAITAAARRGEAAQQDVIRAFEEYARRLSDTAALSDATTQEQIARQIELRGRIAGVSEELIRASTIGLRAGDDIAVGGKKAADGWKQVSDQAEKTASGFKAAADSAEESSRRTTEAAQQTANALRDQRVVQIELTDGWREQAEAIGVNVGAWDRLVQNTEIATDRLLGLSKKRKKQYEDEKKAADDALESTQKLTEQPAASNPVGGLNTGAQRPANTAPATPTPAATQLAGGAGSITINVSGFVTQDALDQVVNRIQRAGLLAR